MRRIACTAFRADCDSSFPSAFAELELASVLYCRTVDRNMTKDFRRPTLCVLSDRRFLSQGKKICRRANRRIQYSMSYTLTPTENHTHTPRHWLTNRFVTVVIGMCKL